MDDRATLDGQPEDGAVPASPGAPDDPAADGVAAAAIADAPAADGGEGEPGAEPGVPARGRRRSLRSQLYLRGRKPRLPKSRGGLFALLLVLSGLGLVAVFTTTTLIHWTETADFCGRCHTMNPELMAYEAGPHSDVSCGECHVEPGIAGWVKSKINGTRQLVEVVLGTYPTPIPPPEHADLPSVEDTCAKCHDVEREELADVRTRAAFSEDEDNTRQFVGLMIRPGGGDVFDVDRGVHWHVVRDLTYWTPDEDAASIDYIEAEQEDGSIAQYIAQDKITVAEDVEPDIAAIKDVEKATDMTCYDCHNRTGHAIPNPRVGLDYELSTGGVDATLPYIKREAMRVLWAGYPDQETADAEAEKLRGFYETNYPEIAATKGA
ncbi:MAG TPA: NapC/NirT family cytochrome c, partial [Candidatus Limnocylindrales bacterium]|nr:NapC/NirT family cytochrome c [Candidatus Limnocylindrales bacterium]